MKINTKIISEGFTCGSCEYDNIELAIEATESSGVKTCYRCAFDSLKYERLLNGTVNKYANYDREETYEMEVVWTIQKSLNALEL